MYIVQISYDPDPANFENEDVFVGPFSDSKEAEEWMNAIPDQDDLIEANVCYMNTVSNPSLMNYPMGWGVFQTEHYSRRLFNQKGE